jgi:hypothetical protein
MNYDDNLPSGVSIPGVTTEALPDPTMPAEMPEAVRLEVEGDWGYIMGGPLERVYALIREALLTSAPPPDPE